VSSSRKRARKDQDNTSVSPSPVRHHVAHDEGNEIDFAVDPTSAFALLVLAIMIGRAAAAGDYASLKAFVMNAAVIFTVILTYLIYYIGEDEQHGRPVAKLSRSCRWTAMWYLLNGCFFHLLLDGFTGTFQMVPFILTQYNQLDRRFSPSNPTHTVPWTVGLIEMFVMAPLCFYCYIAIKKGWSSRWPVEIIVSVCHVFGMVIFCVTEIKDGQTNIPAGKPIGDRVGGLFAHRDFSDNDQLTFYWFGFVVCNIVWAVVPYMRIAAATEHIVKCLGKQ